MIENEKTRCYQTIYEKLRMIRTYEYMGTVTRYINRWNPLNYLYYIFMFIAMPFMCMVETYTLSDAFDEYKQSIKHLISGKIC